MGVRFSIQYAVHKKNTNELHHSRCFAGFIGALREAPIEWFSYDLEMKTHEQSRNNKRTEIKRFDWFIERIQTHLAFGWLSERSAEKTSCPKNFLEIALTSYCNTIGRSNNAFSYIRIFFGGKTKSPSFVLFNHWLIKQITNTYRNHFSRTYENRSINISTVFFSLCLIMI